MIYYVRSKGLDPNKVFTWAFGENWQSIPYTAIGDVWNRRHPELFEAHDGNLIADFVDMICENWRKQCQDTL